MWEFGAIRQGVISCAVKVILAQIFPTITFVYLHGFIAPQ